MNTALRNMPAALVAAAALLLGTVQAVFAAATLTISSPGAGRFVLEGANLGGLSALDVSLRYDATALANPVVEQGGLLSGAMMAANTNVPGVVRVAVIRATPVSGSGTILTFTFSRTGTSPGSITGLSARLSDLNGKQLASSVRILNPVESAASGAGGPPQDAAVARSDASSPKTASGAPAFMAGLVVPSREDAPKEREAQAELEANTRPPIEPAAPQIAKSAPAPHMAVSSEGTASAAAVHVLPGVASRFRDYRGERTPKALLGLLDQENAIGFRQDPVVVLSDGKAVARVLFIAPADRKSAPDMALAGAKLDSVKKDPDYTNTWIAVVRPFRNAGEAAITVPLAGITMVLPIAVVPPVNADFDNSGVVAENDFLLFLQGPRGKKPGRFDLNNDGMVNYLDDYFFTANYFMARSRGKAKP